MDNVLHRSGIMLLLVLAVVFASFVHQLARFSTINILPLLPALLGLSGRLTLGTVPGSGAVDVQWYAPAKTWINSLADVINSTDMHGFIFSSAAGADEGSYRTYNYCNMPHVRRQEYARVNDSFELDYVEIIHRHHKRTPYLANTFPHETDSWDCSDEGIFYHASPLQPGSAGRGGRATYWQVGSSDANPFRAGGFSGTCQFPQITREGLDDSWQHGRDLFGVYHDLLAFLPDRPDDGSVAFRVTNNVITSQVASMVVGGMWARAPNSSSSSSSHSIAAAFPLRVQPASVDSLEPAYACPAAAALYRSFGVGSSADPRWAAHLAACAPLLAALDRVSAVPPDDAPFHQSLDHYFDNLSARQCHAKPLPCAATCVGQAQADQVYRLGQWEYSHIYRDAPGSLPAAAASYGVWLAELALHLRDRVSRHSPVRYTHNVAHDISVARLLSLLQVDKMVWPGTGAELVFEFYRRAPAAAAADARRWVRILWGGQPFRSSSPSLGLVDMVDADVLLAYIDGLVGVRAHAVPDLCAG